MAECKVVDFADVVEKPAMIALVEYSGWRGFKMFRKQLFGFRGRGRIMAKDN